MNVQLFFFEYQLQYFKSSKYCDLMIWFLPIFKNICQEFQDCLSGFCLLEKARGPCYSAPLLFFSSKRKSSQNISHFLFQVIFDNNPVPSLFFFFKKKKLTKYFICFSGYFRQRTVVFFSSKKKKFMKYFKFSLSGYFKQ